MNLNRHNVIGPFQFLLFIFVGSEAVLVYWMSLVWKLETNERIVVGALSIAVLIAVLVIFTIVYWIKIYSEMEKKKMKHSLGNHGIGNNSERAEIISKWPVDQLYYDTQDELWYYISKNNESKLAKWEEVIFPEKK